MSYAYRGGDERAAALDREIARLEARLTPIFWERVAPLWNVAPPGALDLEGDPIGARHARLERLREAVLRIEAAGGRPMGELGELPEPSLREKHRSEWDSEVGALVRHLRALVPGEPTFAARGVQRWGTRFVFDGSPIDADVQREVQGKNAFHQLALATPVPLSSRVTLRKEGILQDVLEMLGLREEIELGDERFDPVFVVGGDRESAHALLPLPVRRSLLDLTVERVAVLDAHAGLVRVRCMLPVSREALRQTLRALAMMHSTPAPHPLLAADSDRMPGEREGR